jgi:aryl carrier-like protein
VRIGPPIANTQFYVLDKQAQPVPLGIPGELFIGGDGVARGYFQRAELTREKFLTDPFHTGNRMYRTGDLVRALPDGSLEFLGRLDNQVKIRGFRIELGEIENVLLQQAHVKEAVVVAHGQSGAEKLIAYVSPERESTCEAEGLRQSLGAVLPAYMIPAAFVVLESLPRTPNGKVDRKALPEANLSRASRSARAPRTTTEQMLHDILREVLHLNTISIDDNLFEMGVDSIQIFQIAARANRAGMDISVQQVLRNPTIEALSLASVTASPSERKPKLKPIVPVSRERFRVKNRE